MKTISEKTECTNLKGNLMNANLDDDKAVKGRYYSIIRHSGLCL